jgi:hypothetical protein
MNLDDLKKYFLKESQLYFAKDLFNVLAFIKIILINVFNNEYKLGIKINKIVYYYYFNDLPTLVKFYKNLEVTHRFVDNKIISFDEFILLYPITHIYILNNIDEIGSYINKHGIIRYDYWKYSEYISYLPKLNNNCGIFIEVFKEIKYILRIIKENHVILYKEYDTLPSVYNELKTLYVKYNCIYDEFDDTIKFIDNIQYEKIQSLC